MRRWLMLTIALLMVGGCYNPPRGGVTPYPPGPVDTLNILLRNDYSRLCPEHYDYCRAGKRSQARRSARKLGLTIRKSADCLIAIVALEHEALLVHNDRDFLALARVAPHLLVYPGQRIAPSR